jgi:1,4-dihydroxy-2-naphthoyl-CoA hydrolase
VKPLCLTDKVRAVQIEPPQEAQMLQIDTNVSFLDRPVPKQAPRGLTPLYQPFPKLMGVEVIEATPTRVRATLAVRSEFCRSGHMLHGGAMMAFADMVGSIGAFLNLPEGAATTTIESKTNFMGPAEEGSIIEAEAIPMHVGRRSSVWQTRITREDGKLLALVTQTQVVLEAK